MNHVESYIRKTEALLAAEKLKEGMTPSEIRAFDLGANWLMSFADELFDKIFKEKPNELG